MHSDDLIDLDQLCELGRMGKDAYRHQRRQGTTPPAYKIGRRLYFKRADALEWLHTVRMVPLDVPAGPPAAGTGSGAFDPPTRAPEPPSKRDGLRAS